MNRSIDSNRVDANSCAGIAGIAIGRFDPTLTFVIEADPATFDAYAFRNSRQEFAGSIIIGNNDWKYLQFSIKTCLALKIRDNNTPSYNDTDFSEKVCKIISGYTSLINKFIWMK